MTEQEQQKAVEASNELFRRAQAEPARPRRRLLEEAAFAGQERMRYPNSYEQLDAALARAFFSVRPNCRTQALLRGEQSADT